MASLINVSNVALWCIVLCFSGLSQASLLNFLRMPSHDGVNRVKHFTEEQITKVTEAVSLGTNIVLVENDNSTDTECACNKLEGNVNFAEVLAQLVYPDNISVVSVKIKNSGLLNTTLYKFFGIHVFVDGKHYTYRGKRDLTNLVSYIKKIKTNPLKVIAGKLDKLAFDGIQQTRLVGFFVLGTGDYQAFESAAKNLAPDVPFYVVFDRLVAKHLKMDTVGQISLYKPSQKIPIPCPTNPASSLDIENFVKQNGVSAFLYLTEENIEETLSLDVAPNTVIALGEKTSSLGGYFNRLLTKVIRNNTDNKYESLNVIWIDSEVFPIITMMKEYLGKTYGMPRTLPAMGVIEFSTNKSAWFNSQLLNMTANKQADDQNVAMIKEWLSSVVNSTLLLQKSHDSQTLIRSPKNVEVEEGSNFELDCIVQNIVGDCLWLRNGKNIGFNLDRLPHLSWVGEHSLGDCSIKFSGATTGRDDGKWTCEVTGDEIHATVSSPPVEVVIKPKTLLETVRSAVHQDVKPEL